MLIKGLILHFVHEPGSDRELRAEQSYSLTITSNNTQLLKIPNDVVPTNHANL